MSDTPNIRFKGFTDTWEQSKLGDLAIFNPNANLPEEFEYVDLESVVGTEMLSHRTEGKQTAPSRAQRLAQYGDLFYQTVRPYQKNNYLFEKSDKNYVFSTGYAQMRPLVDGRFLLSLVQNEHFVKIVLENCTGTSYPAINSNDLARIEVFSPADAEEQKQIGFFFKSVDHLITLQQRKCDEMAGLKNFMLQKMFPQNGEQFPEIRFNGFTDTWEQRKFGDIGSVSMCKRIFKEETSDDGDIPFYKIGTFGSKPDAYISRELFEEYKAKFSFPEKGDILLSASGTIGRIVEYSGEEAYFQDSNIIWLSHNKSVCNKFLKVLYATVRWDGIEGSTIQRLYNDNFLKTKFMMPQIEEQEKLGKFFSRFDNLITLHQRKCDELKEIKKFMLQNMFPKKG